MDAKLIDLIRRRERLLVRAEAQRAEVADIVQQWHTPIAAIDRALAVGQTLKTHPLLLVIPLVALAIWRPSRLAVWAGRGWMAWRFWRRFQHSSPLVKWLKHAK